MMFLKNNKNTEKLQINSIVKKFQGATHDKKARAAVAKQKKVDKFRKMQIDELHSDI